MMRVYWRNVHHSSGSGKKSEESGKIPILPELSDEYSLDCGVTQGGLTSFLFYFLTINITILSRDQ